MRWLAALSIVALLFCGASPIDAASAPANYDAFGVTLLERLTQTTSSENVFISPVSIGVALAMASDGAAGSTRAQILHALGLPMNNAANANADLIAALQGNADAKVGLANAIWLRADLPPNPAYVKLLETQYGATAKAVDFASPQAAATINDWVKSQTLGLIDHLIDHTNALDFAYLTNALAFQAKWSSPFKPQSTAPHPFTSADGTKTTVQMMHQDGEFSTSRGNGYDVVRLPYGKGGFAAYVILPDAQDTTELLKHFTGASFNHIITSLQPKRIGLSLPRFTASYHTGLIPALKAMGIETAFGPHADFSPMHAPPPFLSVSSVEHATYLRVDEAGTTAAAATSVGVTELINLARPLKQIVVDHPFVFALRDERSGTLLFLGTIRKL